MHAIPICAVEQIVVDPCFTAELHHYSGATIALFLVAIYIVKQVVSNCVAKGNLHHHAVAVEIGEDILLDDIVVIVNIKPQPWSHFGIGKHISSVYAM